MGRIEQNIKKLFSYLQSAPCTSTGDAWISGKELQEKTDLTPSEINDAVEVLEERGHVEAQIALGTAPYIFEKIRIASNSRKVNLFCT
jgi:hypothetical protein